MTDSFLGPDGQFRCRWSGSAPEFLDYHDKEWGYPVAEDIRLVEKLCLESFQSGLSWRTILNKREAFRAAFAGFDFRQVAKFDQTDVERLLADQSIVRHQDKIEAVINNAARMIELVVQEGSFAAFVWKYEPAAAELSAPQSQSQSPASVALSKELKKRGWKFVGPTTVFAFMQAMGLINDHALDCVFRAKATRARQVFEIPV